jgi:hypothetical protein
MPVRKTETRIPENFQAADLGQAEAAPDGRSTLVSLIISPLAVNRDNTYVLFVTDNALATSIQTFEWSFAENGGTPSTQTTQFGEATYRPTATGNLVVTVRMLGSGGSEQATITMNQEVVALNAELEAMITEARNDPGPGIGNLDVARELVNDHNPYYQAVTPQTPADTDGYKRFVFSMVSDGALHRTPAQRKTHLDQLAAAINTNGDLVTPSAAGAGVCGIRLALLAMVLPQASGSKWISWTELPDTANERGTADEQLRRTLAELDENKRIDLFNLTRFPKTNITLCGKILEALRDRYFNSANFNDVLTGMSGTRAHWISRHYREGPLAT